MPSKRFILGSTTETIPSPPDSMETLLANLTDRMVRVINTAEPVCVCSSTGAVLPKPDWFDCEDVKVGDTVKFYNGPELKVLGFDNG